MGKRQILDRKQRNLLLFSNVCCTPERTWVYELLQENRTIEKNFKNIKLENWQKVQIRENLSSWLKVARTEWAPKIGKGAIETVRSDDDKKCSLCGNSHLDALHTLVNKINKKEIKVGSDCAKIAGDGVVGEEQIAEGRRMQRIEQIQEQIPKIRSIVDRWENPLLTTSIILNYRDEKEFKSLGRKLKEIYNEVSKKGFNQQKVDNMKEIIKEGNNYIKKFEQYCKKNSDEKYILTRDLYNEILRTQEIEGKNIIRMIREEGDNFITWKTAHRIKALSFLRMIKEELNKVIDKYGDKIIDIRKNNFILKFKRCPYCEFEIDPSSFIISFGGLLFNKTIKYDDSLKEIYDSLKITDSSSYFNAIAKVGGYINKSRVVKLYDPIDDPLMNWKLRDKIIEVKKEFQQRQKDNLHLISDNLLKLQKLEGNSTEFNQLQDGLNSIINTVEKSKEPINSHISDLRSVGEEGETDYLKQINEGIMKNKLILSKYRNQIKIIQGDHINFSKYDNSFIDFIILESRKIIRVSPSKLIRLSIPLHLSDDKEEEAQKIVKYLQNSKQFDREEYRKEWKYYIESLEIRKTLRN